MFEKEPCRNGEEDDDTDFAAGNKEKLNDEAADAYGQCLVSKRIVNNEMVRKNHKHRDDSEQFNR